MKRITLALGLSLACSLLVNAQTVHNNGSAEVSNQTSAAANPGNKSITLDSGTQLAGELQNTVDVRHAKVGDQVVLKTTQAIKSNGRTVVSKGSRLVGHVTEVAQKTKDSSESRVGIIFDRLEQGTLQMPIAASISSITRANASARAGNDDLFASDTSAGESARASSSTRSSSSGNGGGLLGGVGSAVNTTTSTAGGLVGNTTSAVGSTVNSTTGAVGNTASGVGHSLGGIQISESSNTSVEGNSVLSLQGGNLKLEKGTNFNLVLTQSASAGTGKNQ
jgi:hypothetical protein